MKLQNTTLCTLQRIFLNKIKMHFRLFFLSKKYSTHSKSCYSDINSKLAGIKNETNLKRKRKNNNGRELLLWYKFCSEFLFPIYNDIECRLFIIILFAFTSFPTLLPLFRGLRLPFMFVTEQKDVLKEILCNSKSR